MPSSRPSSPDGPATRRVRAAARALAAGAALAVVLAACIPAPPSGPGGKAKPTTTTTTTTTVTVPAPPPPPVGFPSSATTGVPAGLSLSPTGDLTITTDGAVIDRKDVNGCVTVHADNVTIKRSRIRGNCWVLVRTIGARNLVLQDVELDGRGGTDVAVGYDNYTVRRADIHNVIDGPRAGDNIVIEDSYIHDLVQVGGSHNDGIQSTGGRNIVIRRNNIQHPNNQTSAILIGADLGSIRDVLIEGNLLNGGNFTVYAGTGGYSATNIRIVNNRFGRDHVYGIRSTNVPITWSGNVWHNTGTAAN